MKYVALFFLLLLIPSYARAVDQRDTGATHTASITVSSSTAGTEVCSGIRNYCTVTVRPGATVRLWFVRVNVALACATAVTAYAGFPRAELESYEFTPREDGWLGKICAIRESGSGADTAVTTNGW